MKPAVNSILEAVANPTGRFRTLDNLYAITGEDGQPIVTSSSAAVGVRVEWRGKEYIMKFLDESHAPDARRVAAAIETMRVSWLAPSIYLESQVWLFDNRGEGAWHDIVLQEIPPGKSLVDYLQAHASSGDREPLAKLFRNFCDMAACLGVAGIAHNKIRPQGIIVCDGAYPTLIDNERVTVGSGNVDADDEPLSILAVLLFIAACRPELFLSLRQRRLNQPANFRSIIPDLITIARETDNLALELISEGLLQCKTTIMGRVGVIRLLTLLKDKIEPWKELSSLLNPEPFWEASGPMSDTLRAVMRSGKWSYVDRSGKSVFAAEYDYADDFFEGRAVVSCGSDYGLIDRKGDTIMPIVFEQVRWYGREGIAIAVYEGKYTLHNRGGAKVCDKEWDWLGDPGEGLIAAAKDGKYGYIAYDGSTTIEFRFTNAYDFRNGRAVVELGGKETSIDTAGVCAAN